MNRSWRVLLVIVFLAIAGPVHADDSQSSTSSDPVFVGAGDIASCGLKGDEQTAKLIETLIEQFDSTVFTAGDNAYENGTLAEFNRCYGPSWGKFKSRTRPAPGNHEYVTPGATAYFSYFGDNAGPKGKGYYSFDLGAWHIVSLNSNL